MNNTVYLSDKEVAARYGVARNTVWLWARDKTKSFPRAIKLSDNCTRWKLQDLEAWEASIQAMKGAA